MNDPADIWETLKLNFQATDHAQKAHGLSEFRNIRIRHEEDLPAFIARFEECYKKVEEAGEKVAEPHRIFQLVQNLPIDYDSLSM